MSEAMDAAVEAAAKVECERYNTPWEILDAEERDEYRTDVTSLVEAAAPYLKAEALRQAAGVLLGDGNERVPVGFDPDTHADYGAWLASRADALDPQTAQDAPGAAVEPRTDVGGTHGPTEAQNDAETKRGGGE